ncbi:hypothetical protein BY458DRAFT_526070 [Sporodiniella umbellata]|nr:hypothetical protein BY458DRAFT_526070 [Sporodiniella umbellata]
MSITAVHPLYTGETDMKPFEEEEMNERILETGSQQLRKSSLLKEYEALSSEIVVMQSKLEILRMEMDVSVKAIYNKGELSEQVFTIFEKKLENYQLNLSVMAPTPVGHPIAFSPPASSLLDQRSTSDMQVSPPPKLARSGSIVSGLLMMTPPQTPTEPYRPYDTLPATDFQHKKTSRNALDDSLDFLDTLSVNTDDGGLRQDLLNFIDQYNHTKNKSKTHGFFRKTAHFLFMAFWHWIKFTIIMFLAIIISLKQYKTHSHFH